MSEVQVYELLNSSFTANGLFQIAVLIAVFIAFRVARFSQGSSIFPKVMSTAFGLMTVFFGMTVGANRYLSQEVAAIRLADAKAAGVQLSAASEAWIAQFNATAGSVATQNYLADPGTVAFSAIVAIIVLGITWGPKINFGSD